MRTCDHCGAPLDVESACTACEVDRDVRRSLHAGERVAWLYACSRRVLRLARRYRNEEGTGGERERACFEAFATYRARIRELRAEHLRAFARPGLHKADTRETENRSAPRLRLA